MPSYMYKYVYMLFIDLQADRCITPMGGMRHPHIYCLKFLFFFLHWVTLFQCCIKQKSLVNLDWLNSQPANHSYLANLSVQAPQATGPSQDVFLFTSTCLALKAFFLHIHDWKGIF